jgi:hypothetical protein
MIWSVEKNATARKLALFSCACCRRIWDSLPDNRYTRAVETLEGFVDGFVSLDETQAAQTEAWAAARNSREEWLWGGQRPWEQAVWAVEIATWTREITHSVPFTVSTTELEDDGECPDQSGILRCIFGPLPFRPVTLDPAWLTPTVQSIAQTIYTDRAFDRLPILADALEESGCANEEILNHLRQPGVHVKGCWALDLVLGKE